MKTDLEKFKELYTSMGIVFEENVMPKFVELVLVTKKKDQSDIYIEFTLDGVYKEHIAYS